MYLHHEVTENTAGALPVGTSTAISLVSYRVTQRVSRYLTSGAPTQCAQCANPFHHNGENLACWHGTDGRYYCSEVCAAKPSQHGRQKNKAA